MEKWYINGSWIRVKLISKTISIEIYGEKTQWLNYHVLPIAVFIESKSIDIYLGVNPRGGGSQFQSG